MKSSVIEWIDYDEDEEIEEGEYLVAFENYHNRKEIVVEMFTYNNKQWCEHYNLDPVLFFNEKGVVKAYSKLPVYK